MVLSEPSQADGWPPNGKACRKHLYSDREYWVLGCGRTSCFTRLSIALSEVGSFLAPMLVIGIQAGTWTRRLRRGSLVGLIITGELLSEVPLPVAANATTTLPVRISPLFRERRSGHSHRKRGCQ
jgi:hypothetical protein